VKKQPKKLALKKETLLSLGMTSQELELARGGSEILTETSDDPERKKKILTTWGY